MENASEQATVAKLVAAGGLAAATAATLVRRRCRYAPAPRLRIVRTAGAESGNPAVEEVLEQLRQVKDPGLGDIVACGFVTEVQADRDSGRVAFRLEVEAFQAMAKAAAGKLPWVTSVEVLKAGQAPSAAPAAKAPAPLAPEPLGPASAAGTGAAKKPPAPPNRPMPQMPASLDKVKSIIAVSSCKGGVGKSTVAVNLAFELQKSGAKVGIFDCDVYGPSLPVMVRFDEPPQMGMYVDDEQQKHISPVVHEESGIKLVSFGYAGKAAVMRGSMVTGLIAQLMNQTDWGELDYLVLDMPPGTGDIQLTLAQVCKITAAVIVTTPQKLSIIDVERGISMFSQLNVPSVAVVQNMSYMTMPDGSRTYPFGQTFAGRNIADTFGIDHVFEMPLEPAVAEAGDSGCPFVTKSASPASEESSGSAEASKEMERLAAAVTAEVEQILCDVRRPLVSYDETRNIVRVDMPDGEAFGIDPSVLRARDKGAGASTPAEPGAYPAEIREMGNYAIVIRWSDGLVQVAPHRQLVEGDVHGPMPRVSVDETVPVL